MGASPLCKRTERPAGYWLAPAGNLGRLQLLPPHRQQRVNILSPGARGSPGSAVLPLPSAWGPASPLAAAALRPRRSLF